MGAGGEAQKKVSLTGLLETCFYRQQGKKTQGKGWNKRKYATTFNPLHLEFMKNYFED